VPIELDVLCHLGLPRCRALVPTISPLRRIH
jgi:hypothetical protein